MPNQTTSTIKEELQKLNLSVSLSIEQLKQQQNFLKQCKSNLDLLKKQFYLSTSYWTQIGLWFDSLSFYMKLLVYIKIILVSCVVGLMSFAAGLVLFLCSFIVLTLLNQHIDKENNQRWANFSLVILQLETTLQDQIKAFTIIQNKLLELFEVLQKKNEELSQVHKKLSEEVDFMQQRDNSLKTKIAELNQSIETLKKQSEDVQVKNKEFAKCTDDIMNKLKELNQEQVTIFSSKDIAEFESGVDKLYLTMAQVRHDLNEQKQNYKPEEMELDSEKTTMIAIDEAGEIARAILSKPKVKITNTPMVEENNPRFC